MILKTLCVGLLALPLAFGAVIPVVNASFEDPALPDGTGLTPRPTLCAALNPPGYGCIGFGAGWVAPYFEGDSSGTMDPTTAMFATIPDGENIAYSNGGPFYQILPATVTPGVTYTLQVWAGKRADVGGNLIGTFYDNQGYFMELSVAGVGDAVTAFSGRTVLARRTNNYDPVAFPYPTFNATDAPSMGYGNWLLVTLSYTVPLNGPTGPLMIAFGSPAIQASFDLVSVFDDTNVPEPTTAALGLLGMALVVGGKRLRRK